jgi:hypothetical protein
MTSCGLPLSAGGQFPNEPFGGPGSAALAGQAAATANTTAAVACSRLTA